MTSTSTAVTPTELADQLRLAVARTARRLRQEAGAGLSPSQSAALVSVDRHGPLTPSELADHEQVQRPTATRIVDRLVADGLVERTPDPDDRRSVRIATTARGRATLRAARKRKTAFLARALGELPAEDRATLQRAAVLLEALLEERR
jgi:DNA-binding MarR family transcriptional regulator